eukprot:8162655-Karenia_brevis.AAC.1
MSPGVAQACEHALTSQADGSPFQEGANLDRQELVSRVQTLEASLKTLPDTDVFARPRSALVAEIEAVKKTITDLRPLSERIVLARQCL